MKKPLAIALATVACLTAGSGATVLAKPKVKKVQTTVTLNYAKTTTTTPSGPYTPSVTSIRSVFSGEVTAKKGCQKGRDISVTNTDTSAVVGTITNSDDGSYSISLSSAAPSGTYQATAKKKKIKKHGKKIVCKKGKSNTAKVQ
jgi:hypothetical protein